ncbi:MAG: phytoene/squalene synthase family protein [Proteobacteria bacterium]|nr:phytoene/squalene synthase family protein [Pseudomonadota bacterium]
MDQLVEQAKSRLARGSKSFAAAAALLPSRQRESIVLLYSWCRHCDDVIDEEELGFETSRPGIPIAERLERLREGTLAALQGRASQPEFLALERVAHQHRIPERYPMELIHGMSMDATGHRYRAIDETLSYCYHVAGVVGVMSAIILGVRDRPTLERASDLGIAFQLTNIARDVVADARRGRVYLPETWLDEAGIARGELLEPAYRPALFAVARRLLDVSDEYYRSASVGIAELPARSAWAVAAARRIYARIGTKMRERGPASWDQRLWTSPANKLAAASLAIVDALSPRSTPLKATVPRDGLWTPDPLIG